jgi:hypothetical protein
MTKKASQSMNTTRRAMHHCEYPAHGRSEHVLIILYSWYDSFVFLATTLPFLSSLHWLRHSLVFFTGVSPFSAIIPCPRQFPNTIPFCCQNQVDFPMENKNLGQDTRYWPFYLYIIYCPAGCEPIPFVFRTLAPPYLAKKNLRTFPGSQVSGWFWHFC